MISIVLITILKRIENFFKCIKSIDWVFFNAMKISISPFYGFQTLLGVFGSLPPIDALKKVKRSLFPYPPLILVKNLLYWKLKTIKNNLSRQVHLDRRLWRGKGRRELKCAIWMETGMAKLDKTFIGLNNSKLEKEFEIS